MASRGALIGLVLAPCVAGPRARAWPGMDPAHESWDWRSPHPMCHANGTCSERPDEPTPRTLGTTRFKRQYPDWFKAHAHLCRVAARDGPTAGVVLLGDSITESLTGRQVGKPREWCRDVPPVLAQELGLLRPLPLAIGGDQTQHLLWRLVHGEYEAPLRERGVPVVILIGTNNLGFGHTPAQAVRGIEAVASWLLAHTRARLLVLALLPRADTPKGAALRVALSARAGPDAAPSFAPLVSAVNAALPVALDRLRRTHGSARVGSADCGPALLNASGSIDPDLAPDLLHPRAEGMRRVLRCVRGRLLELGMAPHRPAAAAGLSAGPLHS